MNQLATCLSLAILLVTDAGIGRAEDSESSAMSKRIDVLLAKKLAETGEAPGTVCDDATFLRRVTLDLTGRNPSPAEIPIFLENPDPNKRAIWIDRLLESPSCSVHLANVWSAWLLPEASMPEFANGRSGLHTWLRNRFQENLRYDRLVADLLVASGGSSEGPGMFFLSLEGKPEKLAAKTSRVFLGVQLDCAECHDHPFDHWKQRDFWSFAAYFARISAAPMRVPNGLAEVSDLAEGEVTLPGTSEVIAPRPLVATGLSGIESGTRRQQLTLWLTARENPYLARAAVNRVWSVMFGRGLIEPIDDMRALDLASHPELLDELSKHFAKTRFDLRDLIRTIANSQSYQRANRDADRIHPVGSYAVMPVKPLTATQMAICLQQVARTFVGNSAQAQADQLASQLGKLRSEGGNAALGIVQALVTLHSEQLNPVYHENDSRLLKALSAPHLDRTQQIHWMFLATLCRTPTNQELAAITSSLDEVNKDGTSQDPSAPPESSTNENRKSSTARTSPTWQADLLWALINSTEFAMTP